MGLILGLAVGACGDDPGPPLPGERPTHAADAPALAASEPLPASLGIGRAATEDEISGIDIDVMPDGTGLPPGRGTAAEGAPIYAARCGACHGPAGEGTELASALVGRSPGDAFGFGLSREAERSKTVGNYWPWATTLFDYIHRAMPFDSPGTLTPDEVYALTAWILARNGIIQDDEVMDATSLPGVRMPARDRFVRDDRTTSDRVR